MISKSTDKLELIGKMKLRITLVSPLIVKRFQEMKRV
jgi:hypothetical protein